MSSTDSSASLMSHALAGAEELLAEIALAHDLRVANVGGRSLFEHPAVVEHDDAVGEVEHDVHVVLDDDDGQACAAGS